MFFCADRLDSPICLLARNPTVGLLISFSTALRLSGDMVGTVLLFETSPEISNRDIAGSTLVESAIRRAQSYRCGSIRGGCPPNWYGSSLPRWGSRSSTPTKFFLINVLLFLLKRQCIDFLSIHAYCAFAKVEANTIRVHEWRTDYAIVSIYIY